ncbi:MAG TPA: hypothetical protein VHD14_16465 [Pseudolabrys sp.]|nr:hypothetical protein [Pseudolabrys sp.]
MRIRAAIVFALALCAPAAAQEKSVAELFEQFGLFGSWAANCDREPAVDNVRATISRQDAGNVVEDDDPGRGYQINRYSIVKAKKVSDEQLSVEVVYRPNTKEEQRQEQVWLVREGSWRTMMNKPKGERARVKNGIVVGTTIKTPTLRKCRDTPVRRQASLRGRTRHSPG